ncbi:MAG TPA: hypothetical protein VHU40_16395 [Polyangia bacterium]|nr:hypothetical protein [Polyangia bacterium]
MSVALAGRAAQSDTLLSAGAIASGDNQNFRWQQAQADWRHEGEGSGQRLTVRGQQYALQEPFAGIRAFDGREGGFEAAAHVMAGLWWFEGSGGFQGESDRHDTLGGLTMARAIPAGAGTFTPRVSVSRGPVGFSPVPLSLGMFSDRVEAAVSWRAGGWLAEVSYRLDLWEATRASGRVANGALDVIPSNRIQFVQGYVLSQGTYFDWGLAGKAIWSQHGTLAATQWWPSYQYTWYPAYAPPFAWESALVMRVHARAERPFTVSAQVQLPLVSRETRQWDAVRVSSWGTAPFEAKGLARWSFLPSTAVQLSGTFFAKPWERWNPVGVGAYLQASVGLGLEQKI